VDCEVAGYMSQNSNIPICIAPCDGIGPEVLDAIIRVLQAARAPLTYHPIEMGHAAYLAGHSSGMSPEARASVERHGILLKGPMETPKGHGVKSINVTARKLWSTYANKRLFRSLPGVETPFSKASIAVAITMVRENIEDTYGGIEHMMTHDVAVCRRMVTRPGSLKVHRYAFELARRNQAARLTCGHKANIMKLTDGLFLECFYETAKAYPEIAVDDMIVDDMAMKLASRPDRFDHIVLPNLQGDILSDLCAGLVGGLGFAPSANIGDHVAIFEAVHGTAPDIAGKGLANPTSLLLSATMMLRHLGIYPAASLIEQALYTTLRSGARTRDFGDPTTPAQTTEEFVSALCTRVTSLTELSERESAPGSSPTPKHVERPPAPARTIVLQTQKTATERVVGIDLFVESDLPPDELAGRCLALVHAPYALTMISNRGTQVWPNGSRLTECVNQYRLRIELANSHQASQEGLLHVAIAIGGVARLCSTEMLLQLGERRAFSLAQGQ
jgi:isocitrate dehydrogenase